MHRSYGLQGFLKRRRKHPHPTSINGYHTAKNGLGAIVYKWPTFAFADESEYTLAFANRIAHSGLHAETGGRFGWGAIITLDTSCTFTNIPGPGIRTASFAAFGAWSGAPKERRKPSEQRCAYARRCSEGVAAPLGCVIFLQFGDVAVFSLCAQYFLNVRGRGVLLPSACFTCC